MGLPRFPPEAAAPSNSTSSCSGSRRDSARPLPGRGRETIAAIFAFGVTGCAGGRPASVPKPVPDRATSGCNTYMSHGRRIQATCATAGGWDSNTPIIGFTQVDSVSYDTGLFSDDFDYEDFSNIYNSVGPGSDMYDGYGYSKWASAAYGAEIAMTQQGPPTGKCNDSLKGVGDTVGLVNIDGATSQRLVVDINTVFAYGGSKLVGGTRSSCRPRWSDGSIRTTPARIGSRKTAPYRGSSALTLASTSENGCSSKPDSSEPRTSKLRYLLAGRRLRKQRIP